jgi:hypothetical protein
LLIRAQFITVPRPENRLATASARSGMESIALGQGGKLLG